MIGMDRATGRPIDGDAHLQQSIGDLLMTPIGSRPMRRDYGCALAELLDAPLNAFTRIRMFAAAAIAIAKWEPRLELTRVQLRAGADGRAEIRLDGYRTDLPAPNSLTRITLPLPLPPASLAQLQAA